MVSATVAALNNIGQSFVFDQYGFDRIDRTDTMPLVVPLYFHLGTQTSVVAFDDPTLHQHRPAKSKENSAGIAPDGTRQNLTGTPAAMTAVVNVIHSRMTRPQYRGPVCCFTFRRADGSACFYPLRDLPYPPDLPYSRSPSERSHLWLRDGSAA